MAGNNWKLRHGNVARPRYFMAGKQTRVHYGGKTSWQTTHMIYTGEMHRPSSFQIGYIVQNVG